MKISRTARHRLKARFNVEVLEGRALLAAAAETFNPPSLAGLIEQAHHGVNTAPEGFQVMLHALQTQLTSGPLADLNAGTVTADEFVTEVQNLVTSYDSNVDTQLLPEFKNCDTILKLQGARVVADVTSINQQNFVGLISDAQLKTESAAAINGLTGGPLQPINTPLSALVKVTQEFEVDLNTLASSLSASATPNLTLDDVNTTLQAEAEAYRAKLASALQVTNPNINKTADTTITTLEDASTKIAQTAPTDAQTQLQAAITAFDNAILDTTGLFGPAGPVAQAQSSSNDHDHNSDSA